MIAHPERLRIAGARTKMTQAMKTLEGILRAIGNRQGFQPEQADLEAIYVDLKVFMAKHDRKLFEFVSQEG